MSGIDALLTSDIWYLTSAFSSHHFAEYEQDNEDYEHADGHQHKTKARIVMRFFQDYARYLSNLFHALDIVFQRAPRGGRGAMQRLAGLCAFWLTGNDWRRRT